MLRTGVGGPNPQISAYSGGPEPVSNTMLLGTTWVPLPNGMSFCPSGGLHGDRNWTPSPTIAVNTMPIPTPSPRRLFSPSSHHSHSFTLMNVEVKQTVLRMSRNTNKRPASTVWCTLCHCCKDCKFYSQCWNNKQSADSSDSIVYLSRVTAILIEDG